MTTKKTDTIKYLEKIMGEALSLGLLLESIRKADEISQVNFAAKLKISKANLCDIEKGRKFLTPERAAKFAKILGYSPGLFVRLTLQDQINKAGLKLNIILENDS
jgi:plasmid maintenance system antidote protein VapI